MEEKERYVIRYDLDYNQCLIDTEENQGVGDYIQIVKLLNQQSKRIKELEEELKNYKLCRCVDCSTEYEKGLETSIDELENENQQLKQSQKQLAISKLEEVYEVVKYYNSEANKHEPYIDALDIEKYIDDKIKSLKGEE